MKHSTKSERAALIAKNNADGHVRVELANKSGHIEVIFEGCVSNYGADKIMAVILPKAPKRARRKNGK